MNNSPFRELSKSEMDSWLKQTHIMALLTEGLWEYAIPEAAAKQAAFQPGIVEFILNLLQGGNARSDGYLRDAEGKSRQYIGQGRAYYALAYVGEANPSLVPAIWMAVLQTDWKKSYVRNICAVAIRTRYLPAEVVPELERPFRKQNYQLTDGIGHALMYSERGRALVRAYLLEGKHQDHDYAFRGAAHGIAVAKLPDWTPHQMEGCLEAMIQHADMHDPCGINGIHRAIARYGKSAWGALFARCSALNLDDQYNRGWDLERELALILARTGGIDEMFNVYGVHNLTIARMLMRAIAANLLPLWNYKDNPCPELQNVEKILSHLRYIALEREGKPRYEALATMRLLLVHGKVSFDGAVQIVHNLPQLLGSSDPQSHAWTLQVLREVGLLLLGDKPELVKLYQELVDSFSQSVLNQLQLLSLAGEDVGLTPLHNNYFGSLAEVKTTSKLAERRSLLAKYRQALNAAGANDSGNFITQFFLTFGGLYEAMLSHEAEAIAQLRRPLQFVNPAVNSAPAATGVEAT